MKRVLWNLLKRAFRRCLLEDVDAVLLAAFERRLIDTCALHEMDAAFKYGHEIIRKRATFTGETTGVFHYGTGPTMAVIALAIAACCAAAPARAQEPPPCGTKEQPEACLSLTSGVVSVITRGERSEYATMGVTLEAPIGGFALFANFDMFGVQDGGSIDSFNPQSFRSTKVEAGLSKRAGAFQFNARGGATFSVEGQVGRPIDPRMFEGLLEAELRLNQGGHLTLRGGHDGTVGGWAVGADVEISVAGGPAIVARYDFPFQRGATGRLPYVVTAGMRVKVKSFRLSLPR
jgi:hypothetical protein